MLMIIPPMIHVAWFLIGFGIIAIAAAKDVWATEENQLAKMAIGQSVIGGTLIIHLIYLFFTVGLGL